jgi:hypothetical protein
MIIKCNQYCPTYWLSSSTLLWEATIIWLSTDFYFFSSVAWSWKLEFSSFCVVIPSSKPRSRDSMRGVVVSLISSFMFRILVFMELSYCRKSYTSLWYSCKSLSASRVRFCVEIGLLLQVPGVQRRELNSGDLFQERGSDSCSINLYNFYGRSIFYIDLFY